MNRIQKTELGSALRSRISVNVRRLRMLRGMSQGELALHSGMARSFLSRLERGHNGISVENLAAVALALDTNIELLLASSEVNN